MAKKPTAQRGKSRKAENDREPLTAAVRAAIEQSGLSRYEVAKRSGVNEAALSRFMNGAAGLSLATLDRLAPVLGLRIVVDRPKPSRERRGW